MSTIESDALERGHPRIIADRYEVRGELGSGGMGVVYRARDRFLNKDVAIKMLKTKSLTPEQFLRFQNEANALAKLQHPNVILVYTLGEHDGLPFMVVEYLDGISLSAYIKSRGPLSFEEAFPIFEQICDGMSYAHAKGVLHRDLKTANIMLKNLQTSGSSSAPHVVILDFGIAKLQDDARGELTQPGQIFGSPLYMSPEQAMGGRVDLRADVYAMGCLIFEVLTGTTPITGDNFLDLVRKIKDDPPPSLKEACPEGTFSDAVEYVVRKALAKSAASRYQKMSHLKVALSTAKASPDVVPLLKVEKSIGRKPIILTATIVVLIMGGIVFSVASHRIPTSKELGRMGTDTPDVGQSLLVVDEQRRYGRYLDAHSSETITDEIMEKTQAQLAKCDVVVLKDAQITDKGLRFIPPQAWKINLTNTQITDNGLRYLSQHCKTVRVLHLSECHNLTDSGLKYLNDFPQLLYLSLSSKMVTDNGMRVIGDHRTIEQVDFEGMKNLTNRGLGYIVQNPKIKTMRLDSTSITSSGFPLLSRLKKLWLLDIGWLKVKDDDLKLLPKLSKLTHLNLSGNDLTPKALKILVKLPNLEELTIRKVPTIPDSDLDKFARKKGCVVKIW